MRTIKTITCHDVYNYGASLQAYALATFLRNKGYSVEVINYKPDYQNPKAFTYFSKNFKNYEAIQKNKFLKTLYIIKRIFNYYFVAKHIDPTAKRNFDNFTEAKVIVTNLTYRSIADLKKNLPLADIYIAGSDQIWNTKMNNGNDPSFFLDFVPDGKRRVSYAASFATSKIYNNLESFVCEKLKKFDHIAVREKTGVRLLQGLGFNSAVQVLDPVFLLNKEQWLTLTHRNYSEKYILVYDIYATYGQESILSDVAKKLAKRHSLKIWSINTTTRLDYADQTFHVGPIEFLELLNSAECVISNSFHGTAFSVIFNKDFYTIGLGDKIDSQSRMTDFLGSINLSSRYINNLSDLDKTQDIDYSIVNNIIENDISASKKYLIESVK